MADVDWTSMSIDGPVHGIGTFGFDLVNQPRWLDQPSGGVRCSAVRNVSELVTRFVEAVTTSLGVVTQLLRRLRTETGALRRSMQRSVRTR